MIKLIFILIILLILFLQVFDQSDVSELKVPSEVKEVKTKETLNIVPFNTPTEVLKQGKTKIKEPFANANTEVDMKPTKPWSQVTLNENDEYPYKFYIKARIPSLNDYQNWKQVIPNIEFNPKSGELMIPSKDEASALALANLIIINFLGQLSLQNILEKNLIQISVTKAKTHEMVRNKLREQISENLYGRKTLDKEISNGKASLSSEQNNNNSEFEQDLAKNINFKAEKFSDTFEHFSDNMKKSESDICAFSGNDFSYL